MIVIANPIFPGFTLKVTGAGLSRLWLDLARLGLLLLRPSPGSALRASPRPFKFTPGDLFAPERRSAAPAPRRIPRSTVNKAG